MSRSRQNLGFSSLPCSLGCPVHGCSNLTLQTCGGAHSHLPACLPWYLSSSHLLNFENESAHVVQMFCLAYHHISILPLPSSSPLQTAVGGRRRWVICHWVKWGAVFEASSWVPESLESAQPTVIPEAVCLGISLSQRYMGWVSCPYLCACGGGWVCAILTGTYWPN